MSAAGAVRGASAAPGGAGGPAVRRRRERGPLACFGLHAGLVVASFVAAFPVLWIVLTSIKPRGTWETTRVEFVRDPTLANYTEVLGGQFVRWFANSLVVAALTTVFGVFIAASTGYAVSRFRYPSMRGVMWLLLVTQMFPVAVLIVPIYTLMARLGLINSHIGLVITYLTVAVPFSAWMMKGYFDTIPVEIDEAGRVDGLSPFGAFYRLMLPLARPGLAVAAFYSFITAWGEVAYATAFLTGDTSYTLTVGLQTYVGQYRAQWGLVTAASVLIAVPAAAIFLLVQRNLVTGLTSGATKS